MEKEINRQVGKYIIKGCDLYTDDEFFKITAEGHSIYLSNLSVFDTDSLIEGDEKQVKRVLVRERLSAKRKINKLNQIIGEER